MGQSKSKSALEKHCVPLGVYPHCDWPLKTIKHLVCSKKLAPIYRGVDEQTSKDLEECPICFFFYPNGLNRASCCKQSLCTECYLQIKGNPTNIISCPFCNKEDLKVVFLGPKSVEERKQEEEETRKVEEAEKRMRDEERQRDAERLKKREEEKKKKPLVVEEVRVEPPPPPPPVVQQLVPIQNFNPDNAANADELEQLMIEEAIRLSLMGEH